MKKGLIYFSAITMISLIICSVIYYWNKSTIILTVLMFTPMISALIARVVTGEGFAGMYLKPYFKRNWKWYLLVYIGTPLIAFFGAVLYFLIFRQDWNPLESLYAEEIGITTLSEYFQRLCIMIPLAVLVNPIMGVLPCFGEEFAWRGYLLPKLCGIMSYKRGVIVDGMIWGLWHAPIIAMGYNYGEEHPILGILTMIVFCVVLGIIAAFLLDITKSIWCPVIFHAAINAIDLYPPSAMFMAKEPNMFIGPDLIGVIGGAGFIIIAIIIFVKYKPNLLAYLQFQAEQGKHYNE